MAELKYIPFYPGYMEDTSDLSDSEFRRLMYALCAYCVGAEQPEPLTGKEVIAYRFITRNIKVSQEQYTAKCMKNSENAKKRTIAKQANTKNKEQRTKNKIYLSYLTILKIYVTLKALLRASAHLHTLQRKQLRIIPRIQNCGNC